MKYTSKGGWRYNFRKAVQEFIETNDNQEWEYAGVSWMLDWTESNRVLLWADGSVVSWIGCPNDDDYMTMGEMGWNYIEEFKDLA